VEVDDGLCPPRLCCLIHCNAEGTVNLRFSIIDQVLVCSVAYLVLLGYLIYLPVRRKTSLPPDVVDDESPSIQDPLVPAEMDTTV